MHTPNRFDAVLLIAFGGPQGPDDVRPFLQNVLRGRPVAAERIEEVVRHYAHFGGVSPLTEWTNRHSDCLWVRLNRSGLQLPVYVGMRNWHPLLADTLQQMSDAGVRRAVGVILAPQKCYSSCGQYKENVLEARRALLESGRPDIDVTFVDDWHRNTRFIEACADGTRASLERLHPAASSFARLIFTAHSIPMSMARVSTYAEQVHESARLVARRLKHDDWAVAFQSRSGRPGDPWLAPDICDYLRSERETGLRAAVLVPIGFVCDHIEVLWDLDEEAADVCRQLGITMVRAPTAGVQPAFVSMVADLVMETCRRDVSDLRLPIVAKPNV